MTEPNEAVITDAKVREELRVRIDCELRENILPFWIEHAVDHENGGFYGALKNDVRVLNDVPRSSVICARML
jgi:mannobiose 2-epimerase